MEASFSSLHGTEYVLRILHLIDLFNWSLKMNHQAQVFFATAKESCCSKISTAVTGHNHGFQENWKPLTQCKTQCFTSEDFFTVLAWVLEQDVFSLSMLRACKMSRFCFDTYWKDVRISLFLSPNRTQLKIKSHIALQRHWMSETGTVF